MNRWIRLEHTKREPINVMRKPLVRHSEQKGENQ
ncbi:Uncharacterised protein [Vibrio cholerae]|nr:Uncharacterised protein [Vibrio cholerae]